MCPGRPAKMQARFRFTPDILRRLGEELNPSLDQGILELVKNAYDADAHECRIELRGTDQPGGSVRVADDGFGMTAEDIIGGWLVLGRSTKSALRPTPLGRLPSGSKGLGRLAALRLGRTATLLSRPSAESAVEYVLTIDWDAFEGVSLVDDVPLTIVGRPRPKGAASGTDILLADLRTCILPGDVKRLSRALVLLADPFVQDPSSFQPILSAPEYADAEAFVQHRYFGDAEFHLTAVLDEAGRAHATVTDWQGATLFKALHSDLTAARHGAHYRCPRATFDLWAFILNRNSFASRASTLAEVKLWLQAFGGVHLYLNGLRVSPYGGPANDWMEMNLRRAQIAEERPSTNNSIGRLAVSDAQAALLQKTDRSGFVEGEAFHELKAFATDALEWMGKRRLELADQRRSKARVEAPRQTERSRHLVEKAIESAPKRKREELKGAFDSYNRSRDREVDALRREVQLYRTLSTAGITAATFAHESSGNPIKVITLSARTIERRGKIALRAEYASLLARPVESILASVASLAVLGSATLSLIDHSKRRVGRVDVYAVIQGILTTFQPFLAGREVSVETELAAGNPYLRSSHAAIEAILTNLLNNSLASFERVQPHTRRILIRTTITAHVLRLSVLDNGPGIAGIALDDIWLPGETTRPNGTGLGLTIVRDTVRDIGGEVSAREHGELGGAEFTIELPLLGV